jgi:hypothetical protein
VFSKTFFNIQPDTLHKINTEMGHERMDKIKLARDTMLFSPEDGNSTFLRNSGIYRVYSAPKHRTARHPNRRENLKPHMPQGILHWHVTA